MSTGTRGFHFCALVLLVFAGCEQRDTGPVVDDGQPVRLVVQAAEGVDTAALETAIETGVGTVTELEPLFPGVDSDNDPEGLSRMYVVVGNLRGADETDWDAAYRVAELAAVEQAEPDAYATLEQPTAAARATCWAADDLAPEDTAWSLRATRTPQAWTLELPPGGTRFGEGVRICHPDTGWSVHADLDSDRLDLAGALDLLTSGGNAQDPLEDGPLLHPGHGTATGSVIASSGGVNASGTTAPGGVTGVAPRATLVPIRTVKSVVQLFDSDLARAVRHAVDADCDVISMSLGGRLFFGLRAAVRDAAANDVIVAAAAGNCVRMVVAPAVYDDCIAVAGVDFQGQPWRGTSRGRAVTVAGPAQHVWAAKKTVGSEDAVAPSQGTSFAVATVAGAAALWLGARGEEARARYPDSVRLQDVFTLLLEQTSHRPDGWNDRKYGVGIVDAAALLAAELPGVEAVESSRNRRTAPQTTVRSLERVFDADTDALLDALAQTFGVDRDQIQRRIEEWGPEFVHLAMANAGEIYALLDSPATDTASRRRAAGAIRGQASTRLRNALEP